uniref:Predicted protein n=1 Tax=Hordeum vulgare subsp. vulgare TaxID=112509 RepID=F2DWG2_HORVV|nr:predicted protein [Hordeum vulgare subsp. vulgare]
MSPVNVSGADSDDSGASLVLKGRRPSSCRRPAASSPCGLVPLPPTRRRISDLGGLRVASPPVSTWARRRMLLRGIPASRPRIPDPRVPTYPFLVLLAGGGNWRSSLSSQSICLFPCHVAACQQSPVCC